jgi:hypothetical protein
MLSYRSCGYTNIIAFLRESECMCVWVSEGMSEREFGIEGNLESPGHETWLHYCIAVLVSFASRSFK